MAEAILNGDIDEQTGEWIGNGQGFPRTLTKKWHSKGLITTGKYLTENPKLNGVIICVRNRWLKNWQTVIQEYDKKVLNKTTGRTNNEIAEDIQINFSRFVIWLNTQIKNKQWVNNINKK